MSLFIVRGAAAQSRTVVEKKINICRTAAVRLFPRRCAASPRKLSDEDQRVQTGQHGNVQTDGGVNKKICWLKTVWLQAAVIFFFCCNI